MKNSIIKPFLVLLLLISYVQVAYSSKKDKVYVSYCKSHSDFRNGKWERFDSPVKIKKKRSSYTFVPCDNQYRFPTHSAYLVKDSEGKMFVNVQDIDGFEEYDKPSSRKGPFKRCIAFTDSSCVMTVGVHKIDYNSKGEEMQPNRGIFKKPAMIVWRKVCYLIRDRSVPVIPGPDNMEKILYKTPDIATDYLLGTGAHKQAPSYVIPYFIRAGLIPHE